MDIDVKNAYSKAIQACGSKAFLGFIAEIHRFIDFISINGAEDRFDEFCSIYVQKDIDKAELVPMRDLREETGSFEDFIKGESDDYISIILTDEVRVPEAFSRLRQKYPNLLKTDYVNRVGSGSDDGDIIRTKDKAPVEIFSGLFEKMNGKQMTEQQQKTVSTLIERIWRESE